MCDFLIKAYGWQELAVLYAPELTPESASKRLGYWIRYHPNLSQALQEAGWKKGQRVLTPLQVEVIIKYLGEP